MMHWRTAVGIIREELTTHFPEHWREDIADVGDHFGVLDGFMITAIRAWADSEGIADNGWREDIDELARKLANRNPRGWRHSFILLAMHLSGEYIPFDPVIKFILDDEPPQPHFQYKWIPGGVWAADGIWRE